MLGKFSGKSENCQVLKTRTNQPKILKIPRPKTNDAEQYGNFSSMGVPLFPKILKTVPVHSWNFRNFILTVHFVALSLHAPIEICIRFQNIKDRLCKRGLASV